MAALIPAAPASPMMPGIVGAGGNAGAVAAGFLFRSEGMAVQQGFLYLGLAVTGVSIAALAVRLAPETAEGVEPAREAVPLPAGLVEA